MQSVSVSSDLRESQRPDFKGIVCFLKWGHIKSISIVGLFPTVITDQRSLSVETQRAAQLCAAVNRVQRKREINHLKQFKCTL